MRRKGRRTSSPARHRASVTKLLSQLAKHGTVVLVGRDQRKLADVQQTIEKKGQHAMSVRCDLSDLASVRRAAMAIVALELPIVGLINNAGTSDTHATTNPQGWDRTFATD